MNLTELSPGLKGRVKGVCHLENYQATICRQLEDIGFLPGEQVEVLRKSIFSRGAILARVGSSTFALSEVEARMVEVELL